jgi:Amt family ammonium transporter
MLMVPALALFYSGFVSPRAVVHTMMLSFSSLAVVAVTWSLIGYSMAFGPSGLTNIIGDSHFGFFDSASRVRVGTQVPEHAYFMFQLQVSLFATTHDIDRRSSHPRLSLAVRNNHGGRY